MRRMHNTSPASHTSIEAFKHSRNLEAIGLFLFTFFQAMALDFAKDSPNFTNFLREQPNFVQLNCLTARKLEVLAADASKRWLH
ncbi:unnamed protein product [Sphagnum jensenii]|uniref:Uncharacterized protein n=1 Tax=Sphagnum jensenii TaxID=128206 RepID=A0ABP0V8D5_9BRYO